MNWTAIITDKTATPYLEYLIDSNGVIRIRNLTNAEAIEVDAEQQAAVLAIWQTLITESLPQRAPEFYPKFLSGPVANRPSAGQPGGEERFYLTTDGAVANLYVDNGELWDLLIGADAEAEVSSMRSLGSGSQQAAAYSHEHSDPELAIASDADPPVEDPPMVTVFPPSVPGLELWLEAQDSSRADGEAIANWCDCRSRGRKAVQTNALWRPTFKADGINGFPAVQFNNQFLRADELAAMFNGANKPHTVVMVCKRLSLPSSGGGRYWMVSNSLSGTPYHRLEALSSGHAFRIDRRGVASSSRSEVRGGSLDLNVHVLSEVFTGAQDSLFQDGVKVWCDVAVLDTTMNGLNVFSIGAGYDGPNGPVGFNHALIGELLIFSRALTATERQNIETYLNRKWGIGA